MDRIAKLAEKFKNAQIVSDGVDVLDEIYEKNVELIGEIESIRFVRAFLLGLCVGESLSELTEENPFHFFTMWNKTMFSMFLDRHDYYMNGNQLIKKF